MSYVPPTCTMTVGSATPPNRQPCIINIPIASSGTVALVVTGVELSTSVPARSILLEAPVIHNLAGDSPILPQTPSAVLSAGGSITAGTHTYKTTNVINGTESFPSLVSETITSTAGGVGDATVTLTVPFGPTGTSSRNVYRTLANTTNGWRLMGSIADNTTAAYTDDAVDGSGVTPPSIYGVTIPAGTTKTLHARVTPMVAGVASLIRAKITFHRTDSTHDTAYPDVTTSDLELMATGVTITPS